MKLTLDRELIKKSAKLLSVLSHWDNLSIFMFASSGQLMAETASLQKLKLSRKVYYTRLKQLIDAGLVEKAEGTYRHTSLGNIIYQNHIVRLVEELKNTKQLRIIDTLTHAGQFSEDDIARFVSQISGSPSDFFITDTMSSSSSSPAKIEVAWNYQDMLSAIVQRVESCKSEILLATRSFNEVIINSILRKANSGIDVKVLADSSLVKQYAEVADNNLIKLNRNSSESLDTITGPWHFKKIQRRLTTIPCSMIVFDGAEVGIEIVNGNEPTQFYSTIFIKDERTSKTMVDFYHKMWDDAAYEKQ
jgi:predicted transcriptional regulator